MSDEIVRRLMRKNAALSIKESLLLEAGEDDEDIEDDDLNFSTEDTESQEDEEELTPDEEDALDKKLSRSRAPKSSHIPDDEEFPEDIGEEEPEEDPAPKLEPTSPKDKGNANPLDNAYAINFGLGEEITIVYTDGTPTGIEGTIDGYDNEGFYRIRVRDGFTISGLTDIALSSLIKSTSESKCLCGGDHFVTEGKYIVCDDCGRRIRESMDQLTMLDKKRPKGKRMIRSIPHDMSTSVKPNIAGTVTESVDEDEFEEECGTCGTVNTYSTSDVKKDRAANKYYVYCMKCKDKIYL